MTIGDKKMFRWNVFIAMLQSESIVYIYTSHPVFSNVNKKVPIQGQFIVKMISAIAPIHEFRTVQSRKTHPVVCTAHVYGQSKRLKIFRIECMYTCVTVR